MVLLVTNAAALAWAGMWLGLKCKGRIRAILGSLAVVLFVPWVMAQLLRTMWTFGVATTLSRYALNHELQAWENITLLIPSLIVDLLIIGAAVSRLPRTFRQLAIRR